MNPVERVCLHPSRKLVEAVSGWLAENRLRDDPSGAKSLAHVCVVVPTAQSGRRLRFALARRFPRGVVPPRVVQPMQLAVPADRTPRPATDAELAAAFLAFVRERPARRVENGRVTEVREWTHLFRPEALDDGDAAFSLFDQLRDIWRILGAGGLLMGDVPRNERARPVLEEALGDEVERWNELAELEAAFFAFLRERGIRHPAECVHLAKTAPAPLPGEISTVVLPALADPIPVLHDVLAGQRHALEIVVLLHCAETEADRFDEWGRPLPERWTGDARPILPLADEDVVCAASDGKLAKAIAADFPDAASGLQPPSLGLCDENLFEGLSAAFPARGYELHDPEKFRLSASSLGRIAGRLLALHALPGEGSWDDLAGLMREDDVMRFLTRGRDAPCRERVLEGLDLYRNAKLPTTVPAPGAWNPDGFERESERRAVRDLAAAADRMTRWLRAARKDGGDGTDPVAFLRSALGSLYKGRILGNEPGDREFAAAIDALDGVLAGFDGDVVPALGLDGAGRTALLRKFLADAVYSLEPDAPDALTTDGWLELAWSPNDKIALAGFREGCVPDTVTGHVFLPEKLRNALGLPSNDRRLARDAFLLSSLLASRHPGDVRAYYARTSDEGDIHKPSRLLFLVRDGELAARTKRLFGALPPDEPRAPRIVAEAWRPNLPDSAPLQGASEEDPEGHLSPSAIDAWLANPLGYLLTFGLGMRKTEEKEELEANDFGSLLHRTLELYANRQLERTAAGEGQLADEEEIRTSLFGIFDGIVRDFGRSQNLRIQLDSLRRRLEWFAGIQAHWAAEGWRIADVPEKRFLVRPFAGEEGCDVRIKGSVDRIDVKEGVGYRLIDYKTWDDEEKARAHVFSSGAAQAGYAERLALPTVSLPGDLKNDGTLRANASPRRLLSVQLPLYARCLEALDPDRYRGRIADLCYLVLGANAEDARVFGSSHETEPFRAGPVRLLDTARDALDTARRAIRAIRANLFWPPGPENALQYDLAEIVLNSVEGDLKGSPWLAEQEKRLADFAEKGART